MSQYNFSSMQPVQIATEIFYAGEPSAIAPMFEELATLDDARRTAVVNILENEAVRDIRQGGKFIRMALNAAEMMHRELDLSQQIDSEALTKMQAASEIYRNVAAAKGEATHPIVKAYVNEIDQLSQADYNSPQLVLAALHALEAVEGSQPRQPSLFDKIIGFLEGGPVDMQPQAPRAPQPQTRPQAPKPPQASSPTTKDGKSRRFKL